MKEQITAEQLKRRIEELQVSSNALAGVLARVRDEGHTLADRTGTDVNWRWVEQALANIRSYQNEFSKALAKRDPVAISYAAEQFVSIRKYFEDTPLEWSKLEKDLQYHASMTAQKAGKVAFAIDPFDPVSLAEIQRSL
jgi:hypothetical protein